jgi:hypothetical protein
MNLLLKLRYFFQVECCYACLRPKNRTARIKDPHWPHCVNPSCPAYKEPKASAAYRPGIPFLQWRWGKD